MPTNDRQFVPLNIAIMVVSDSRTEATDTSGKTLVERLTAVGHQ
jgi:molybdenum cofactor biosynthesis protein B